MLIRATFVAAVMAAGLAACDQGVDPAKTTPPPEGSSAAAVDSSGGALALAERDAVIAQVAQDTEDCGLPEGVTRQSETADLGGGDGAVIVTCMVGMPDRWTQLYIVEEGGGQHMATPLLGYDISGDGQWHLETETPNLEWLPEQRVFQSIIENNGCGNTTQWRWNGEAVELVRTTVTSDCTEGRPGSSRVIWPTDPATPKPTPGERPADTSEPT